MTMWKLWFVFFAFALSSAADPIEFRLRSHVEPPATIQVGDVVPFSAIARDLPDGPVQIQTTDSSLDLLKEGVYLVPGTEKIESNQLSFSIAPIRGGDIVIPALNILSKNGEIVGRTSSLSLSVQPLETQNPESNDELKYYGPVLLNAPGWVILLAGVLSLIAFGFFVFVVALLIRRLIKNKKPAYVAPARKLTPYEVIIRQLTALDGNGYIKNRQFKEHCFGLSELLKTFLGETYRFDATESTTSELIQKMEGSNVSKDIIKSTQALFDRLDQVKFTKLEFKEQMIKDLTSDSRKLAEEIHRAV